MSLSERPFYQRLEDELRSTLDAPRTTYPPAARGFNIHITNYGLDGSWELITHEMGEVPERTRYPDTPEGRRDLENAILTALARLTPKETTDAPA